MAASSIEATLVERLDALEVAAYTPPVRVLSKRLKFVVELHENAQDCCKWHKMKVLYMNYDTGGKSKRAFDLFRKFCTEDHVHEHC